MKYKAEITRVSETRAFVEVEATTIDKAFEKLSETAHKSKFGRVESVHYKINNLQAVLDVTRDVSAPVPPVSSQDHDSFCCDNDKKCRCNKELELGFA